MAESTVPVDLFNPGQVFACIGLAEAADVLLGEVEAVFDWSDPAATRFRLRAAGEDPPVRCVLSFLDRALVQAIAPAGSPVIPNWKLAWGDKPRAIARELGYPYAHEDKADTLTCELRDGEQVLRIDHWGDSTQRDPVKLWAGAAGYPGVARIQNSLEAGRGRFEADGQDDPFGLFCQSGKRSGTSLDWRRDYVPIDIGFSIDKHGSAFSAGCFPVVEVLAALGLGHARPLRFDSSTYVYSIAGFAGGMHRDFIPLEFLRATLGSTMFPWPMRCFRAAVGRPNEYARVFTTVTEENLA